MSPSLDDPSPLRRHRHEALLAVGPEGVIGHTLATGVHLGWGDGSDVAAPGRLADVVHPGRLAEVEQLLADHVGAGAARLPGSARWRHADGRWIERLVEVEAHLDDPEIRGWVVRLRAATDDHVPTAELPDRFVRLAEVMTAGILTADVDGLVTYANPTARELFWRADDQLRGHGWLDTVRPTDRPEVRAAAERVRDGGTTELVDFRVVVSGLERWLRARFNAVNAGPGRPAGWVAVCDDITTDRAAAVELAHQATHDPLTELPNRVLLEDRLGQAVARSRRHANPLAVLFLDLDRFKAVNDRYGHLAGDDVLREVGRRIRRVVRSDDTAARLGGDEFVVVAEGLDRDAARMVADRVMGAIGAPLRLEADDLELRASIGVAWTGRAELGPDALLEAADRAMYDAKRTALGIAFAPLS